MEEGLAKAEKYEMRAKIGRKKYKAYAIIYPQRTESETKALIDAVYKDWLCELVEGGWKFAEEKEIG